MYKKLIPLHQRLVYLYRNLKIFFMKTVKPFSLFITCIVSLFSCVPKGDPPLPCSSFVISTVFLDSIFSNDITGDSISFPVRFIKDSIKYRIISENINIDVSSPIINSYIINKYATKPINLKNISKSEKIFIYYYLSSTISDTLSIEIKDKTNFKIYNKGKLLSQFITFKKCDELVQIKR